MSTHACMRVCVLSARTYMIPLFYLIFSLINFNTIQNFRCLAKTCVFPYSHVVYQIRFVKISMLLSIDNDVCPEGVQWQTWFNRILMDFKCFTYKTMFKWNIQQYRKIWEYTCIRFFMVKQKPMNSHACWTLSNMLSRTLNAILSNTLSTTWSI